MFELISAMFDLTKEPTAELENKPEDGVTASIERRLVAKGTRNHLDLSGTGLGKLTTDRLIDLFSSLPQDILSIDLRYNGLMDKSLDEQRKIARSLPPSIVSCKYSDGSPSHAIFADKVTVYVGYKTVQSLRTLSLFALKGTGLRNSEEPKNEENFGLLPCILAFLLDKFDIPCDIPVIKRIAEREAVEQAVSGIFGP